MLDPTLHVHLFGTAHVHSGRRAIAEFPTEKAKVLFYYLMLFHREEHPRSVLEGLFWGDRPEARAKHSLRTELWRLRRWLNSLVATAAPALIIQDSKIRFRLDSNCWLDTYEFEQSIERANCVQKATPDQAAMCLREAVDLYGGELLNGYYEDWCLIERERLHQLFLDALLRLMVYYGDKRDYARALEYGRRILQEEPLREDVHRELVRYYANSQQVPQAIAQYQACKTILSTELHIEPEPETQELFRRLITGTYEPCAELPRALGETMLPSVEKIQILARHVQSALQQIEAARYELNETFRLMEHMRHEFEDKVEMSQDL